MAGRSRARKAAWLSAMVVMLAATCALPLTSVSAITLTLLDEQGRKIVSEATATFLDQDGRTIVEVSLGRLPSWDNNIHWWAHSGHETSTLRPNDAKRTRSAIVRAAGCGPVRLPIALTSTYNPPSIMPHGGGSAYMHYEFARTVTLECGEGADTQTIREISGE